jgi:hypothetical protein
MDYLQREKRQPLLQLGRRLRFVIIARPLKKHTVYIIGLIDGGNEASIDDEAGNAGSDAKRYKPFD